MGTDQNTQYPEHERLKKVSDTSNAIGEFLDWLRDEKGVSLMTWQEWEEEEERLTPVRKADGTLETTYMAHHEAWVHLQVRTEELLAEFFHIDLKTIEQEKRAMLDAIRAQNQDEGGK